MLHKRDCMLFAGHTHAVFGKRHYSQQSTHLCTHVIPTHLKHRQEGSSLTSNTRRYLNACPCVHAETSSSYKHSAPITLTAQDSLQVFSPLLHVHLHCVGRPYLIYGAVQQGCELHVERLQLCFSLAPQLPLGDFHLSLACCINTQKCSEVHDRVSEMMMKEVRVGSPKLRSCIVNTICVIEVSRCTRFPSNSV